jgi:hypothetical protein
VISVLQQLLRFRNGRGFSRRGAGWILCIRWRLPWLTRGGLGGKATALLSILEVCLKWMPRAKMLALYALFITHTSWRFLEFFLLRRHHHHSQLGAMQQRQRPQLVKRCCVAPNSSPSIHGKPSFLECICSSSLRSSYSEALLPHSHPSEATHELGTLMVDIFPLIRPLEASVFGTRKFPSFWGNHNLTG